MLIARNREFMRAAATIAAPIAPPPPTIATAANCADPAKTIVDMMIAAALDIPMSWATTPNEIDRMQAAIAKGNPARTPARSPARPTPTPSGADRGSASSSIRPRLVGVPRSSARHHRARTPNPTATPRWTRPIARNASFSDRRVSGVRRDGSMRSSGARPLRMRST